MVKKMRDDVNKNKKSPVFTAQILVAIFLLSLGMGALGCGNFSNEDLIFLAALPDADNLLLKVPGADYGQQSQGLSSSSHALSACAEGDLHCQASQISTGINAAVLALLNMVDHIAMDFPPTQRQAGLRIWGPVYVRAENTSLRFEMQRSVVDGQDKFSYCLHAMRGEADLDLAQDLSCEVEDDPSGLQRLLWGWYQPGLSPVGAPGGASFGQGELLVDLNRSRDAGLGKLDDQGVIQAAYQNDDGGLQIDLQIRDLIDTQTQLPSAADYFYQRQPDDSGRFQFRVNADFVDSFILSRLETLDIQTQWSACQAGRADAVISGGDLADEQQISASQCWDCQGMTVYYSDSSQQNPDQGGADACVELP